MEVKKERLSLIVLFLVGVVFRLWVASLVPQPFLFDQQEYHAYALGILEKGLYAVSARLYGYPLLIAGIYKLFGIGRPFAWQVFQAMMDAGTAVFVYILAKDVFRNTRIALVALLIYVFNPFTSAFVGVLLSEVSGIFFITLACVLLSRVMHKPTGKAMFLLGVTLGFIPQVRPPFIFFTAVLVIGVLFRSYRYATDRASRLILVVFIAGYCLPFVYTVAGNFRYFRQFAPLTVDNVFVRELYISLFVDRSPVYASSPSVFPLEVQTIYNEYSVVPGDKEGRRKMADKYLSLSMQKIASDPLSFIGARIRKFWYVWEKFFFFYYTEPERAGIPIAAAGINFLLLFSAVIGIVRWCLYGIRTMQPDQRTMMFVLLSFIAYITVIFSFSLAEERYSLPGYPITALLAGYGWNWILDRGRELV